MAGFDPIAGETPVDVSGLRLKGIVNRKQLNEAEAENIRKAVLRYLASRPTKRQAPFTLPWCYKLHRQMFGDVWLWAGNRRNVNLNLGVDWHQIDVQLQTLLDDLPAWREYDTYDLVEQATRLHHRAVSIHPFENGNGRWARLLANVYLKHHAGVIIRWPEETIGGQSAIRGEYLAAVKAADNGDIAPLLELHRRYVERQ